MSLFFIGLSPFFPSSSFSSSTFRSLISIHCNLSFLLHLQLHISLYLSTTVRPLFFPEHYPSFMSFFFKPFFPRPLSCSSYTFSHSNLTIFFFYPLSLVHPHFFVSLRWKPFYHPVPSFLRVSFKLSPWLSYSAPSSLFYVSPPRRILWSLTTSLQPPPPQYFPTATARYSCCLLPNPITSQFLIIPVTNTPRYAAFLTRDNSFLVNTGTTEFLRRKTVTYEKQF